VGRTAAEPPSTQTVESDARFAILLKKNNESWSSQESAVDSIAHSVISRRRGLVANIALARKLAALFWRVMVKGMHYVEQGLQHYEAKVSRPNNDPCADSPANSASSWCQCPPQREPRTYLQTTPTHEL